MNNGFGIERDALTEMAARYTYWRTPNGEAYRKDDSRCPHIPKALLADLGTNAVVSNDGTVSWTNLTTFRAELGVLGSIVIFGRDGRELNAYDSRSIVRWALSELVKKRDGNTTISPTKLREEIDRRASAFFRTRTSIYFLVTTLPVTSLPARQITIDNCVIAGLRSRLRYPPPNDLKHLLELASERLPRHNVKHQVIRVRTSGKSQYDAADRAMDSVSLLCGLWNLFAMYGSWKVRGGVRSREPYGVVHLGPVHTLHGADGKPLDEYWYEPDYSEHRKPYTPGGGWASVERLRRWATRQLKVLPYGDALRQLIIRYGFALSKADTDLAFLHMWSVLETITHTGDKGYDQTIRRAIWPYFSERDIAREMLNCARCWRNQYVHGARSNDYREELAQTVKWAIEPHIMSLLRNDFRIQHLCEYGECMDQPASLDALTKRQRRLNRVIKVRRVLGKGK